MRRGEQPRAQASLTVNRLEHRADRAFAVRAGDVDKTQPLVRRPGQRSKSAGVVKPQLRAEQIQLEQMLNGFGIRHDARGSLKTELSSFKRITRN